MKFGVATFWLRSLSPEYCTSTDWGRVVATWTFNECVLSCAWHGWPLTALHANSLDLFVKGPKASKTNSTCSVQLATLNCCMGVSLCRCLCHGVYNDCLYTRGGQTPASVLFAAFEDLQFDPHRIPLQWTSGSLQTVGAHTGLWALIYSLPLNASEQLMSPCVFGFVYMFSQWKRSVADSS